MLPSRPDLDPLPDPPDETSASKLRGVAMFLAFLLVGGTIGFWIGDTIDDVEVSGAALIAAILLGVPGVVAAHELGHVIGGQLAGWRFAMMIVGPLHVEKDGAGLRWKVNRSLGLAGGLALSLPTDTVDLRRGTAMVVAGGPVASVLVGGLGLALGGAWALVGVMSLFIGVATVFPGRTGGFLTDGARLVRLAKGGPAADREAALMSVLSESTAGTRPRDWNADLLEDAVALEDEDPMETSAHSLAMLHALDAGDGDAARRHLERRIELWNATPTAIRGIIASDAAFFEAAVRHDAARARTWLDRV
ncbi:MAG: hypothetical protein WBA11_10180, partial [Rubrivirga sp.]